MEYENETIVEVVRQAARNGTLFNKVDNGTYNHTYTRERGLFFDKEKEIPPELKGYCTNSLLESDGKFAKFFVETRTKNKKNEPSLVSLLLPRDIIIGRWGDAVSWLTVGSLYIADGTYCEFPGYDITWDDHEFDAIGVNIIGETKHEFLCRYREPIFGGDITCELLSMLKIDHGKPKFIDNKPIILDFGLMPVNLDQYHICLESPLNATHLLLFSTMGSPITYSPSTKNLAVDLGIGLSGFVIPMSQAASLLDILEEGLRNRLLRNLFWFINNEANISRIMAKNEVGGYVRSEELYTHYIEVFKRIQNALAKPMFGDLSKSFHNDFTHVLDANLSNWTFKLPSISDKTYSVSRHNLVTLENVAQVLESYLDYPFKKGTEREEDSLTTIESKLDRLLLYELYAEYSSHTAEYLRV